MQKVLTWNIRHGGGDRVDGILDCLSRHTPNTVVLTEYRNNSQGGRLRQALESAGLVHQQPGRAPSGRNSVLVAARDPFDSSFPTSALPGYEHCCIRASFQTLEPFALYFPQADAKGPLFEWLLQQEQALLCQPTLLIGDFNTGIHHVDEQGATFDHADKFIALQRQGWTDLWRDRNRAARQFSWFSAQANGFRLDHALASPLLEVRVRSVYYSHGERESGVSDHSILCVELESGCLTRQWSWPAAVGGAPRPRAAGHRAWG